MKRERSANFEVPNEKMNLVAALALQSSAENYRDQTIAIESFLMGAFKGINPTIGITV